MRIFNELTYINKSSLALGFFDGLHSGHRVVLKNAVNIAKERNVQSVVLTFKSRPSAFFLNQEHELLLTFEEKLQMFENMHIDNAVFLDFKNYASMKADYYLENIIAKYFSPIAITTGFNHTFGFNRQGGSAFLNENKEKYGYRYFEMLPFTVNGNIVSCSVIRNFIGQGDFYNANKLLGYNYFVSGIVINGDKIASKLGFASANINYPENKIKIPFGVYYVKVESEGIEYNGILNHGRAARDINNSAAIKTEVHILDGFNKNIYGKKIKISFIAKIRNQMNFENNNKLKAQILRDIAFTQIYQHFLKNIS